MNLSIHSCWSHCAALVIALLVGAVCCSDPDPTRASPNSGVGGMAGAAGSGGSTAGSCGGWGSSGADPMPMPLDCSYVPKYVFGTSAAFASDADGGNLVEVTVGWCAACEWACGTYGTVTGLAVAPSTAWAEVTGTRMPCGSEFIVQLKPTGGVSGGDLLVTGTIFGEDICHRSLSCPIDLIYHVAINGSTVSITQ
jgi:hypothetical protein